jgi:hypothetical protein
VVGVPCLPLVLVVVFAVLVFVVELVAGLLFTDQGHGILLRASPVAVVALLGAGGYGIYRYANRHVIAERQVREGRARQEAVRRYEHALTYWNQLHYCYRCHGIFLPGNPWQHEAIRTSDPLVAPGYAWAIAQQLADYAEQVNAPQVLRPGE